MSDKKPNDYSRIKKYQYLEIGFNTYIGCLVKTREDNEWDLRQLKDGMIVRYAFSDCIYISRLYMGRDYYDSKEKIMGEDLVIILDNSEDHIYNLVKDWNVEDLLGNNSIEDREFEILSLDSDEFKKENPQYFI